MVGLCQPFSEWVESGMEMIKVFKIGWVKSIKVCVVNFPGKAFLHGS